MKQILITNAYSYKNKGDAGIILSMIDYLKEEFPDSNILVMSRNYKENKEFYDKKYNNVTSIQPLWFIDNNLNGNKVLQLMFSILSLLKILFIMLLFKISSDKRKEKVINNNPEIQAYIKSNLICSCGGGYLFSTNKWPISIGLYQHLFHIFAGKFFNRKVVMFPQSLGPINKKIDMFLLKKTLNKVDMIYPREKYSKALIDKKLLVSKNNYQQLPDIAFIMESESFDIKYFKDNNQKIKIGVTVLDWHWAYADPEEGKKKVKVYLENLASTLDHLIEKYQAEVYVVPQVVVGKEDNDVIASEELIKLISSKRHVHLITDDLTPKELKYLYGTFDMFIGSRMHSCIFAIGAGTPTIGLSYQPKTTGTFEFIGLFNKTLPVDNYTSKELNEISEEILDNLHNAKEECINIANQTKKSIVGSIGSYLRV